MNFAEHGHLVHAALQNAVSQDVTQLKAAEQQLTLWETERNFYCIISDIFVTCDTDTSVRWLSVVYLKNGIEKYWRKTAPHALPESDKAYIRKQLLSHLHEPVSQIRVQLAVLIGKISRVDCPNEWPELLPKLVENIKSEDELVQSSSLLTFYHVIKTLSTKMLPNDRKVFVAVTNDILPFIYELWKHQMTAFNSAMLQKNLDVGHLSLKIIRRLLVSGTKNFHEKEVCVELVKDIFNNQETLLEFRKQSLGSSNQSLVQSVEKYINLSSKILQELIDQHPLSFSKYFILRSLQFVANYAFTDNGREYIYERFVVNCMNIMKFILTCNEYKVSKSLEDVKDPQCSVAQEQKKSFFTDECVREVCQRIVFDYFILSTEDLITWEEYPEEFVISTQSGESWKYQLRACSECLFLTLFREYREVCRDTLLTLLHSTSQCDQDDLQSVLKRDAVLNAVGLASYELSDALDFDSWYVSELQAELTRKLKYSRIIQRRIIALLGQWVGVQFAAELRPSLYQLLVAALDQSSCLVVRLSAAHSLKLAVDDFDFSKEQFCPYLEVSFSHLIHLLQQCSECETKMDVLYVMSFIIERVGSDIKPFVSTLMMYLPSLWDHSADHNALRCAIVDNLNQLVHGLGSGSREFYGLLLPIIQYSTDLNQEAHIFLMEDALELWYNTLLHSSTDSANTLFEVFPNVLNILDRHPDQYRPCFSILHLYLALSPQIFMDKHGRDVVQLCDSLFADIDSKGLVLILRLFELAVRCNVKLASAVFMPLVPRLLKALVEADDYPVLMSMYYSVFSVLFLKDPDFVQSCLEKCCLELNVANSEQLLSQIIVKWVDKINMVTQLERRKLCALTFLTLFTAKPEIAFNMFINLIEACCSILYDVCSVENGQHVDSLLITPQNPVSEIELEAFDDNASFENDIDAEHFQRLRQLCCDDPIYTVSLCTYFFSQLTSLKEKVGEVEFNKVISSVNPETLEELNQFR